MIKLQLWLIITLLFSGGIQLFGIDFYQPQKKLIECSWSTPTPEYLLKNIETMEANTPYNGIRIKLERQVKTENGVILCSPYSVFSNIPWKYEYFKEDIETLKKVKFNKFTDNFLKTTVCPGVKDWFDDDAWKAVCNNFAILSRIAKETNLKGICFDPEQYHSMMLRYDPLSGHSYNDTLKQARKRGQEWGNAVFKNYPNITLFAFFWGSYNLSAAESNNTIEAFRTNVGLFQMFLNGVYDVITPEAKVIDGHEYDGYYAKNLQDFYKLVFDIKTLALRIMDKSNIDKYKRQTQLAAPVYLDGYFVFKPGHTWYLAPNQANRLEAFKNNLEMAYRVSDEYVWSWGEQCFWWQGSFADGKEKQSKANGNAIFWEQKVPGLTKAIMEVQNPNLAMENLKRNLKNPNLLINSDFEKDNSGKAIPNWGFWQDEMVSHGTVSMAVGQGTKNSNAIKMQKVNNGCIIQGVKVEAGKKYFVFGKARKIGNGVPTLLIRWRDAGGNFCCDAINTYVQFNQADSENWQTVQTIITVPDGAHYLVPLFGASAQTTLDDIIYFDDLGVVEVQ